MTAADEQQTVAPPLPNMDFVHLQLEQALSTYQAQLNLLVTIVTALIIADITILGYAVTVKLAGVILIGALFPFVAYNIFHQLNKSIVSVLYTAVYLEQKFGGQDVDWLVSTFVGRMLSPEALQALIQITAEPSPAKRAALLRDLDFHIDGRRSKAFLTVIMVAQLLLPFILSAYFHWEFL